MSNVTRRLPALALSVFLGLGISSLRAEDLLTDVKTRLAIEAQRVEKEFTEGRSAAYKLVRSATPKLVEATEKLQALLAMVQGDKALDVKRREVLLVTLKYDLSKVAEIAGENRRSPTPDSSTSRIVRDSRRSDDDRRVADSRSPGKDASSIIESRGRSVADTRGDRGRFNDGFSRVMRDVDKSATPVSGNVEFPKNWPELSKRRSSEQKITEKEQAILKALNTTIEVNFDKDELENVLDFLRKKTGVTISIDQRAMAEADVTYKTPITLKLRGTIRSVLKRMLADLNMAYIVKEEAIQITSQERAKRETTRKTYYLGDLAGAVNLRMGPILSKLLMIQTVNQLINTITQTVDPQSWKVNNPDAVGTIAFDPITMSLIVVQTAEIHYSLRNR